VLVREREGSERKRRKREDRMHYIAENKTKERYEKEAGAHRGDRKNQG